MLFIYYADSMCEIVSVLYSWKNLKFWLQFRWDGCLQISIRKPLLSIGTVKLEDKRTQRNGRVSAAETWCLNVIVRWLYVWSVYRETSQRGKKLIPQANNEYKIKIKMQFCIIWFIWKWISEYLSNLKLLSMFRASLN